MSEVVVNIVLGGERGAIRQQPDQLGHHLELARTQLADRRWKSSYLIKRALAITGLDRQEEATADLQSGIEPEKYGDDSTINIPSLRSNGE